MSNTDSREIQSKIVYLNQNAQSYIDEYNLQNALIKITVKGKLKRLRELFHLIREEKPDIIYTWGNGETVSILLLKPFLTFKLINGSVRHGIRSKRPSHYFRTVILHLSQFVVANSKAGLKANNLERGEVLYNGLNNNFFLEISDKPEKRKELTNVPEEVPLFISVANLVPYKDYLTVLHALKQLKENGFSFYYLILGDGPLRQEIQKLIYSYGLIANIKILGNITNVHEYLVVSDIFIHSSKGEGCSNAILEAMAAGLPIIATDTGGTSEIIDSSYGRLFSYKDSKCLFEELKTLLKNKELVSEMGKAAYKSAKNCFTVSHMIQKYNQIIYKISKS